MNLERWDEIAGRLEEAAERTEAAERVFASGDAELIELLQWHRSAGDFLNRATARQDVLFKNDSIGRLMRGRYRLESVLGRGGAGIVFLATDEQVAARRVVVKLLHDFWSAENWMRNRFREEAAVLSRLDHPGIVRLIDAGESEEGRLYLVLPYHGGRTLRDALSAAPLDAAFVARLLREIGDAVAYAHDQGVLHRDLKPENILLVRRSEGEHPLLIDFGIAHIGDNTAPTQTTTHLMGSVAYMAPEHLMGKATAASDTYSLGVIAWEMLTGKRPFDSATPFALPELQRRGTGDAFYRLRPGLPTAIGKLLVRALAFDPGRRPTAREFTERLAEALLAGAIDSRLARLWVMRRSRRWMLGGGATALAAAAAGGWLLRDRLAPLSPEERVIDLPAGASAEMTGFRIHRELTERAIRKFPGGQVVAMRLLSPDQGQIHKPLSLRQKRAAFGRGWKVSALWRPESGYAALGFETGQFAPRFDCGLQIRSSGVDLIATRQIRNGWDGIRVPVTLPSPPALLRLEMSYDPAHTSAEITVDGRKLIRGYSGHTEYRDDLGVYFGLGTADGSVASVVFGGLHLEIPG